MVRVPFIHKNAIRYLSYPNAISRQVAATSIGSNRLTEIGFSKVMKTVRVLGLMTLICYMSVILFTWIYANLDGNVYFLAGEPISSIKYFEWALGFTGIFVAFDCLFKEIGITLNR